MTCAGVTAVRDGLKRKGLVVRVPPPADKRRSLVRLIGTGLDEIDDAMKQSVPTEQRLMPRIDKHERARLRVLLGKVLYAVDTK